jgi:DNA-binding beta-propeller fold protein YncE
MSESFWRILMVGAVIGTAACSGAQGSDDPQPLTARVVAVGIPGAGAVTEVGRFLPGGPINDNPAFKASTEPGRVLEPSRILVGSRSNFGAAKATEDAFPGSILSIDAAEAPVLDVPPEFARSGNQATALDGRVQLYSAQSAGFLNRVTSPRAVTADQPGVSNALDISINNAFGRVWPANAPRGLDREGSSTILDPGGMPLAGAPNLRAGGVFSGAMTNREPAQVIEGGLAAGAVATAFLGRALDNPKRAVFAVVTADGAVVAAHAEQGVDGLAPAGTISDLRTAHGADELHAGAALRYYAADPVLYVSDPIANEIVALTLTKDEVGKVRRVGRVERHKRKAFRMPVDLAPTVPEAHHRDWASNTTLAELADIYVLNRGDNTIARMKVDGTIIATRRVSLPGNKALGRAKVNGIATSTDGMKIYVTVTGRLPGYDREGALLELPSFAASTATGS